jgi:hypothetical protein
MVAIAAVVHSVRSNDASEIAVMLTSSQQTAPPRRWHAADGSHFLMPSQLTDSPWRNTDGPEARGEVMRRRDFIKSISGAAAASVVQTALVR